MPPQLTYLVVACDTCLGHRPSRTPLLAFFALVALVGGGWCLAVALRGGPDRRWATFGATGFSVVVLALAVVSVPLGGGSDFRSCSSAIQETSMRHFGPSSSWDESGCGAAGWRRIHQAQVLGGAGAASGFVGIAGCRFAKERLAAVSSEPD